MILVGLLLTFAGSVLAIRLTWVHFGATGLWFLGALAMIQVGEWFLDRGEKP